MNQTIKIAISTCPNDTFAFHGLLTNRVDCRGLKFDFELLDIAELNSRLFAGDFDVAKASFHAALLMTEDLGVLPSGSALGFGVGPLLLAAADTVPGKASSSRVLCPGPHTTATMLYKLFYADCGVIDHVVFSEIMPALSCGDADFGVCIHEGRFTWQEAGLFCVADLGATWEKETGCPLPLGGILARHHLGAETLRNVQAVIYDSLQYGLANRAETVESMGQYAQEFDEGVMFAHVDLYVNEWTVDLGTVGRRALDALSQRAQASGLVEPDLPPLQIVGS